MQSGRSRAPSLAAQKSKTQQPSKVGLPLLGAHFSIARGFAAAAREAADLGAGALQIFLKSPRSSTPTRLDAESAAQYRDTAQQLGIRFLVAHCSYLLNFAKPLAPDSWPIQSLIDDLRGIELLGGAGVVLHIGKHLELSRQDGLDWVVANIQQVLAVTAGSSARILLENTAGQGTELGYSFHELGLVLTGLKHDPRVGFCLDSCHAFAAGYDLSSAAAQAIVLREFDRELGLDRLACVHFNDSKNPLGRRVDRHANLGQGEIGLLGLRALARTLADRSVPLILETPEQGSAGHAADLQILRDFLRD